MTDREKAIVMAFTGICMLTGDKFQIFHKYVEDIMGRPIMTHEIGFLEGAIKKKAEADFMALCADESSSENPNKWIPVSERLPEESLNSVIGWDAYRERCVFVQYIDGHFQITGSDESFDIVAWMPLPKPYKTEMERK